MPRAVYALIVGIGALAAAAVPWLVTVIAWPEIVVPAYFVGRGGQLYETIYFPHTPLLITVTAALGSVFGYSAFLFRSMVSLTMAAGAALIAGAGRRRMTAALSALCAGVPFSIIWLAHTDSIALWPDPMMAPLVLAACLSLERFERRAAPGSLAAGALALGLCILVKQTSAFLGAGAVLWLLLASRRRSMRSLVVLTAGICVPYAVFAAGWAALFETSSHVRWTLVVPLLSGHASEIGRFVSEDFARKLPLYFGSLAAAAAAARLLPASQRLRSPLPWIIVAAAGMAWPRGDLAHMAAGFAAGAVLFGRGVEAAVIGIRRGRRRHWRSRSVAAALAAALSVVLCGVAAVDVSWKRGGPVFFWNDRASEFFAARVRQTIGPDQPFLNFNTPWETLYAITGTTTPSGRYVNPKFWYYLNKDGLGDAFCRDLVQRRGTLVLFSSLDTRVEDPRTADSCLYHVVAGAPVVERVTPLTSWRIIP